MRDVGLLLINWSVQLWKPIYLLFSIANFWAAGGEFDSSIVLAAAACHALSLFLNGMSLLA